MATRVLRTLDLRGQIDDGQWSIDEELSDEVQAEVARHNEQRAFYTLFTRYFERRGPSSVPQGRPRVRWPGASSARASRFIGRSLQASTEAIREEVIQELRRLAIEITTPGDPLNDAVTKDNPDCSLLPFPPDDPGNTTHALP
jgi:hypothetical protein